MVEKIVFDVEKCKSIRVKRIKKKKSPPPNNDINVNYNNSSNVIKIDLKFDVSWFLSPPYGKKNSKPIGQNSENSITAVVHVPNDHRKHPTRATSSTAKILPTKTITQQVHHPPTRNSLVVGLENPLNYCYMNSVIQVLKSINEIRDFFSTVKAKKFFNSSSITSNEFIAAKEFSKVLQKLSAGNLPVISAENFKDAFGNYDERFNNDNQQDTHEFSLALFQLFNNIEQISIISNLFEMEITSYKTCCSCHAKTHTTETLNCTSLPVTGLQNNLLIECFENYFKEEKIQRTCKVCNYESTTLQSCFKRLPTILLIHFNRFNQLGDKLPNFIDYPINGFNISKFVDNSDENISYQLIAITSHKGDTSNAGHYVSCCKSSDDDDKWYEFDDDHVTRVLNVKNYIHRHKGEKKKKENAPSATTAYLLFYRKLTCAINDKGFE